MFVECTVAHPTFFLSRALLKELGGYSDSGWPEGYDLLLRIHEKGLHVAKPEGPVLLQWRDHEHRLSRNDARYKRTAFLQCKAFHLTNYLHRLGIKAVGIWGAGPTGLKLHDFLEDYDIQVAEFYDINPKLVGRTKRGKPVKVAEIPVTPSFISNTLNPSLIAINHRGAAMQMVELFVQHGLCAPHHFLRVS